MVYVYRFSSEVVGSSCCARRESLFTVPADLFSLLFVFQLQNGDMNAAVDLLCQAVEQTVDQYGGSCRGA